MKAKRGPGVYLSKWALAKYVCGTLDSIPNTIQNYKTDLKNRRAKAACGRREGGGGRQRKSARGASGASWQGVLEDPSGPLSQLLLQATTA